MSFIGKAIGSITGASDQAKAAELAGRVQSDAAQSGIDEQRRQFDALRAGMQPYTQAGVPALTGQQDILGLNGGGAQQIAINGIQNSPMFAALQQQGQNAILQNASATGGLRGGNTQAALAQFSPQLLSQLLDQQYSRLGGLTALGQNSAAGVGAAGMQTGANVANLIGQQGAATAGGALARGGVGAQGFNTGLQIAGAAAGAYGGFGGMGGGGSGVISGGSGFMPSGGSSMYSLTGGKF